jgi:acyl carrier protein
VTPSQAAEVRSFVLASVEQPLAAKGLTPANTPDDFDLFTEGVIDSFGIVELIGDLEDRFRVTLDFDGLDPDVVTIVGPLSRYVADLIDQRP